MLVYNIDKTPNKISQISEIVDIILYYQIYAKQKTLLVVSSLEKQDLIFGFTFLKQYNLEVNW